MGNEYRNYGPYGTSSGTISEKRDISLSSSNDIQVYYPGLVSSALNKTDNGAVIAGNSEVGNPVPVHQSPDDDHFPIPIREASEMYILGQLHNGTKTTATMLGSNLTSGASISSAQSLTVANVVSSPAAGSNQSKRGPNMSGLFDFHQLSKRDGAVQCGPGMPCLDSSCCNGVTQKCGYGPDHCGVNCTSNCDAQAMCGQYSTSGTTKCGLNLCCSYYS